MRHGPLARGRTALATLVTLTVWLGPTLPASAEGIASSPPLSTLAEDGRTATDGTRTLMVSKARGVDPNGDTIEVQGLGYNPEKGIYLAFCVLPAPNEVPTPCGGGIPTGDTASGSSYWISSNPPSYGQGMAQAYGPGGSFTATMAIAPVINAANDCRVVRCGIVTRNDHVRTSDRSQDVFIPITFAAPGEAPGPQFPLPPLTVPTTPVAVATRPATVLAADGLTATSDARTLSVSRATNLDPSGDVITVRGQGFDESVGIYVALCAVPPVGTAPTTCAAGSPGVSAWVSSNPPPYGVGLAVPYQPGGAFEVTVTVRPVIDARTDCRLVPCALAARIDDEAATQLPPDSVLVPVSFAAEPAALTSSFTWP